MCFIKYKLLTMSTNNKNSKTTDRKKQSGKAYRWRNCGRRYGGALDLLGLLNSLVNISKKCSLIKFSKKKMALPLLLEGDCCSVKHDKTTLG